MTLREEESHALTRREPSYPTAYEGIVERETSKTDLRRYMSIFMCRRWLMLIVFSIIFVGGLVYTHAQRKVYESTAKIIIASKSASAPVSDNDLPFISDLQALTRSRSAETQAEVITGRDLLNEAFRKLPPTLQAKGFGGHSLPGWAYSVESKKNSDLIALTTRAYDPEAAAKLANAIADTYFKHDLEQNNHAIRQAREYAEEKMAIAKKDLAKANFELSVFKRKTGLFAPDVQLSKPAEHMAQLALDVDASKAQLASAQRSTQIMKSQLTKLHTDVVKETNLSSNPQYASMLDRIDKLNGERASLLEEYTAESKEVRSIDGRIKQAEAELKRVARSVVSSTVHARNPVKDSLLTTYASSMADMSALAARKVALLSELQSCRAAAKELPERERGFEERLQRATLLQKTYEMLSSKYYSLVLSEQATLPNGQLAASAQVPSGPAYPNTRRNTILFLILGTSLAIAAAFIAEGLDSLVRNEVTIEEITGSSTLSMIPLVTGSSPNLVKDRSDRALFESFRILRNNILYAPPSEQVKILAVTSPGRGDGKTTTSINLATSIALAGKRILLVDCDFRRPSLHKMLDIPNEIGLSTVLQGKAELSDAIVQTSQENLYFLPSGRSSSDAIELLGSKATSEAVKSLADEYDIVLVDCAPCVGLGDMPVISRIVDGVVLVVSLDYTQTPQLQLAVKGLMKSSTPLIGLVVNRLNQRNRNHYYYYSYYSEPEEIDQKTSA